MGEREGHGPPASGPVPFLQRRAAEPAERGYEIPPVLGNAAATCEQLLVDFSRTQSLLKFRATTLAAPIRFWQAENTLSNLKYECCLSPLRQLLVTAVGNT